MRATGPTFSARAAAHAGDDAPLSCLAALSLALDLANGVEEEKSQLTAAYAWHIAGEGGCDANARAAAFMAGLLFHVGCTGFAATEAGLADDDIALRASLARADRGSPLALVGALLRSNGRVASRLQSLASAGLHFVEIREHWIREACGAARGLAAPLGCDAAALQALDEVYERWDGRGGPRGMRGDAISLPGRIVQAAHLAVLFYLGDGPGVAAAALQRARGGTLEPAWADAAVAGLAALDDPALPARAFGAPECVAAARGATPAVAAEVFGEFADLQTPHTRGHAGAVAALAQRAAQAIGLGPQRIETLTLAAHLHDLGQVALPTALWMQPRRWRRAEALRARSHAETTQRVLLQAPAYAACAPIAGAHHERLDASGYPRAAGAPMLDRAARLLAVAEAARGMQERRPHRPPLSGAAAADGLRAEARAGRLDAACVDAVLGAYGVGAARRATPALALTEREMEVLRLLATGQTNKQIARSLSISDRTVQTHTLHIYDKLGVDSRAGAALAAARGGWL